MATAYDACIASAQAALGKLSDLEITAMKKGDVAAVDRLQKDCEDLAFRLTQLRALAVGENNRQIAELNQGLDKITAEAQAALDDLSRVTSVLETVLDVAKLIDSIVAAIPK